MSKIFCTYEGSNHKISFIEEGQSLPDGWHEYIWQYAKDGAEAVSQHEDKHDQCMACHDVGLPHEESQEIWDNLSEESKDLFCDEKWWMYDEQSTLVDFDFVMDTFVSVRASKGTNPDDLIMDAKLRFQDVVKTTNFDVVIKEDV